MKSALNNVNSWVGGIIELVDSFVGGGLAGLLALIVFASFLD